MGDRRRGLPDLAHAGEPRVALVQLRVLERTELPIMQKRAGRVDMRSRTRA
jgi:hypothetical protein